jgi:hypothetical protein
MSTVLMNILMKALSSRNGTEDIWKAWKQRDIRNPKYTSRQIWRKGA